MTTDLKRILVVEDEKIVQLHLSRIAASAGHEVVGAVDNAREAIEITRRTNPDLVLMDIRLADGGDGIECAKTLGGQSEAAFVFVTAHSDSETLARAAPVEAAGFVIKPFRSAEVAASISSALAARDRERRVRGRERALTSAVRSLNTALFVVDPHGVIEFANPQGQALSDWQENGDAETSLFEFVHDRDHASLRDAIARALSTESSCTLDGIELRGSIERPSSLRLEPVSDSSTGDRVLVTLNLGSGTGTSKAAPGSDPSAPRLLVYSHDTYGLGHIRRCMNLIRSMADGIEGLSTLLVTGSPVADKFEMPPRTDYLKLPAVRKVAPEAYSPRSLTMSDEGILSLRRNLLLHTVREYSPDLLLVDHSPTGMNGELLPALDHLREAGNCTRILGLRDIIDSPARVEKRWTRDDMFGVLRHNYDHVVIYGASRVYDTTAEYEFPGDLRQRARHVNYVGHSQTGKSEIAVSEPDPRLVVVTIGGGDGGAETIVRPFLEMMRTHGTALGIHAEILLGPFIPAAERQYLHELAAGCEVTFHDFVTNPMPLFARAHLVISTAGYNISSELLACARRALLIPRVLHREEQLIRARRLSELGLVDFLHPEDASPDAIADRVKAALNSTSAPLSESRSGQQIPLDGAHRMVSFVREVLRSRTGRN